MLLVLSDVTIRAVSQHFAEIELKDEKLNGRWAALWHHAIVCVCVCVGSGHNQCANIKFERKLRKVTVDKLIKLFYITQQHYHYCGLADEPVRQRRRQMVKTRSNILNCYAPFFFSSPLFDACHWQILGKRNEMNVPTEQLKHSLCMASCIFAYTSLIRCMEIIALHVVGSVWLVAHDCCCSLLTIGAHLQLSIPCYGTRIEIRLIRMSGQRLWCARNATSQTEKPN